MNVERFLQWVKDAPAERRADAAHALARAYLYSEFTDQVRDRVEAALTVLLDDAAPGVRWALADALGGSERAPHHIILALSNDQSGIAAVVLERSPLLLDAELAEMAAHRGEAVQLAIARRTGLSAILARSLCETAPREVCVTLLGNSTAEFDRESLAKLAERFGEDAELREILLARRDLPVDIRHALVSAMSACLGDVLASRQWMATNQVSDLLRDTREKAAIDMALSASPEDLPALIDLMIEHDELTPGLLIRAVASGHSDFFETALARLAGMPRERVQALIRSGREANLNAVLDKAGIPARAHPALAAAVQVVTDDALSRVDSDYRRATALIDTILGRYPTGAANELDDILTLLRRLALEAKRDAARSFVDALRPAA